MMIDERKHGEKDEKDNAKIFPQRLMEILSEEDNEEAIRWLPHGKAFIVVNRQKFSDAVLPRYFKKSKWASFTRKLNRWNFARISKGPELGAYYHQFFQRGNEALCTQMYCKNNRAKFAATQEADEGKCEAMVNRRNATVRTAPLTFPMHPKDDHLNPGTAREVPGHESKFAMLNRQHLMSTTATTIPLMDRYPAAGSPRRFLVPGLQDPFRITFLGGMANTSAMDQTRMLLVESRKQHENVVQADKTKAILDSAVLVLKRSEELGLKTGPLLNRGQDLQLFSRASYAA